MKTIAQAENLAQTVDRYSYQDLEGEFGIKSTARNDRIKAAVEIGAIEPVHYEGRTPYLDIHQMNELRSQHNYLATGGTLKSYREQRQKHFIKDKNSDGKITADVSPTDLESLSVDEEAIEDPWSEPLRNVRDEIMMNPLIMRHLRLETYHRLGKPISDRDCLEIMDFKPPRTGFKESCYKFNFYGYSHQPGTKQKILEDGSTVEVPCLIKQKLWQIEKLNLEKELLVKQRKKYLKKLESAKHHEVEAIETYDFIKQLMIDE